MLADGKEEEDEEEMQIKAAIEKEKTVYQVRIRRPLTHFGLERRDALLR